MKNVWPWKFDNFYRKFNGHNIVPQWACIVAQTIVFPLVFLI